MEHKGIRYDVLRTTSPNGWKWVVHITASDTKTGFSYSKEMAAFAAKKAIERLSKKEK
jgi:hypothetical protein